MRILVLAVKPLSMRSGDGLRFVNVARELLPEHSFELVCYAKDGQQLDAESAAVFERVRQLPFPAGERSLIARALMPLSSDHFSPSDEPMRRAVAEALTASTFDLVFDIGGLMLSNLPPRGRTPPVVVDSIDEPALTFERALQHAKWSEKPRLWRTKAMYERLNEQIRERADVNVYASELDAAHYARAHPGARVEAIPNGVDTEQFQPRAGAAEPDRIAFEGNLAYEPNADAAVRLCRDVLPLVRRSHPGARVVLIGRDPSPEVRALASEHVEVTGTVDDVREHLLRASVFACPMRLGAGIKNKILQAWALGIPVVASTAALGGLDAVDGEHALVADEDEDFAKRIAQLLDSAELRSKLGASGRRLALEKYTWKAQ